MFWNFTDQAFWQKLFKTAAGQGHSDLQSFGDNGWGDELVAGDLLVKFVPCSFVQQDPYYVHHPRQCNDNGEYGDSDYDDGDYDDGYEDDGDYDHWNTNTELNYNK